MITVRNRDVSHQLKFQLKIPRNKKDIQKFQITFLKNHGCLLRTLTGLALSPRRIHFRIFFLLTVFVYHLDVTILSKFQLKIPKISMRNQWFYKL
jgi:hypothetical protein